MHKFNSLIVVFIVFSFLFGGGFDSFFGQMRDDKPVKSGEVLQYHVNAVNHDDNDLRDVRLRMVVYDLGELIATNSFDVDDHDVTSKFLLWDTADVPTGDYWVRITLSDNKGYREVKHRVLSIY